ncbi:type II toxin-antitoxin system RelE/ParE family toxin [Pseudomonas aestusnigri]|uniref:type II toxin-antitoxin system RelE/ParE family toxin n=1 Tax=Halopseudomonas aestusnigri TaxID=857252 RepID=UPI001D1860BC|nr:type II toxin-antitoxin system RelE/ParE family toxin [Halopseudomonas aestusnigri]MCC4262706.1 type II toxin-antitoxin system RelE/ParE family toxin [Halopseudomonas aestusnigri]
MNKQMSLLGYSSDDGTLVLALMALGAHENFYPISSGARQALSPHHFAPTRLRATNTNKLANTRFQRPECDGAHYFAQSSERKSRD